MTEEQRAALALVHDALRMMPAEPSPALMRRWYGEQRAILREVAAAFPEGSGQ